MSRGKHKFKQSDIVRAVKAARAAGLDPRGVEIDPNGTLRVLFNGTDAQIKQTNSVNEWDVQ
ncbi:hypothetical protein EOW77_0006325 [Bradyrhizobium yuanmingense]|uniref:hypothetical protein n=1 Tax=Bradyrhizobium yuanmingense TaxID=108015 RepID=UPI000FE31F50|nr:hypothetical protein [Bradyrhizobium yuanmingense]TGN89911.1 hypothetical protein EOW77_0006325 [Bradyrhizobium yuanmingense]